MTTPTEEKLKESIETAKKLIEEFKSLQKKDFWCLERNGKSVAWIISHNGCLKIKEEKKIEFSPGALTRRIEETKTLGERWLYVYDGLVLIGDKTKYFYETGEIDVSNYPALRNKDKQACYPDAMANKRCQDRVILKASGLAYEGVFSEEEADEFKLKGE